MYDFKDRASFSLFITSLSLLMLLTACVSGPPLPKQPDESERIPINQITPDEISQLS